jgi:membrane protease YdiL (CAAX protease family)
MNAAEQPEPFWGYADLALFIGMAFPSLLVAFLLMKVVSLAVPMGKPLLGLFAQLLWYALLFASLRVNFRVRYSRPFWSSLGWRFPFPGVLSCLLAGPLVAFGVGFLGYAIKTPEIRMPFQDMLADLPTKVLFSLFVVAIGPLFEELAFRGFLMPLLMRSFGVAAGISLTALVFGGLHAYEYQWSWRHVLLVALAGAVFGWVRYVTGSTAASTFMHCTYNLTQLAAFLAQPK